ncbi:hypothetical protein KPL47_05920 [Clostridium estertheticum]|uniref:hypothetical protein n=1 Tax=Clostridium estertheticum TaxID=238834 RepID=UPI001C0BAA28|nr:hypothetical protein [Clostridium estertheticum]MBU3175902.1 hypothetical protein [Clostridium estertheticum]
MQFKHIFVHLNFRGTLFFTYCSLSNSISQKLTVQVLDKYAFENFEQLYSNFDFSLFGCHDYTMKRMIDETYDIYTKEQGYGALGIKICLI